MARPACADMLSVGFEGLYRQQHDMVKERAGMMKGYGNSGSAANAVPMSGKATVTGRLTLEALTR